MKFCDDCAHLVPKERDQIDKKVMHWCKWHNIRLTHGDWHPQLPRPDYCRFYEKEAEK